MIYLLMNKDFMVAELDIDIPEIIDKFRVHLKHIYIKERMPFNVIAMGKENIDNTLSHWIIHRGIPSNRDGIKIFLNRIGKEDLLKFSLESHSLSLSDQYWIKRPSESLSWSSINFFNNNFTYDIGNVMFSDDNKLGTIDTLSPDCTTNGWLKKAWRIKDNHRYLFKQGSFPYYQEPINEVMASEIIKRFGTIDFVEYNLCNIHGKQCSICENFLDDNTEFLPAFVFSNTEKIPDDVSLYFHLMERCKAYGMNEIEDFISNMLLVDYLICNSDRHLGNFGFLRKVDTLEFIGPAPLFDNGTSLWNQDNTDHLNQTYEISKPFCKTHEEQLLLIRNFDGFKNMDSNEILDIFSKLLNASNMNQNRIHLLLIKFETRVMDLNLYINKQQSKFFDLNNCNLKISDIHCDKNIDLDLER